MLPLIAISLGDPLGIGPEVTLKALADESLRARARWVVFGPACALEDAAKRAKVAGFWKSVGASGVGEPALAPRNAGAVVCVHVDAVDSSGGALQQLSSPERVATWYSRALSNRTACTESGAISHACVEQAIVLAKRGADDAWRASAVCTAPISKHAWKLAGFDQFPGHTELFASRFGVSKFAMMFHAPPTRETGNDGPGAGKTREGPGLNVILATVHQPLRTVAATLTTQRVIECIELGALQLQKLGVASPRIAVAGLNPHAGEQGLLGSEDDAIIAPAIEAANKLPSLSRCEVSGPHPADTVFQRALAWPGQAPEKFDLVVAMYHDQGLIPLKTLAWDRAVNMTVGLPILRTSPDHGTAFDIAGKGVANEGSMKAALAIAVQSAI